MCKPCKLRAYYVQTMGKLFRLVAYLGSWRHNISRTIIWEVIVAPNTHQPLGNVCVHVRVRQL